MIKNWSFSFHFSFLWLKNINLRVFRGIQIFQGSWVGDLLPVFLTSVLLPLLTHHFPRLGSKVSLCPDYFFFVLLHPSSFSSSWNFFNLFILSFSLIYFLSLSFRNFICEDEISYFSFYLFFWPNSSPNEIRLENRK